MSKKIWFLVILSFLIYSGGSSAGLAAGKKSCGWPHQDPVMIANQFLDRLQAAYQTANIPLFISLYNDPSVAADVTRDKNRFYTSAEMKEELEQTFIGLTGIQCTFSGRQITAEGDMIMIRTMRSVTANEIPIYANCLILMVLRKPFSHRQPWDYVVTDQILLKEEYLPKSEVSAGQDNTNNTDQQTPIRKKHRHFAW